MQAYQKHARVNGTNIYYEVAGNGPPLVLIHGSGLDTRVWAAQVPALAQSYQVICYDRRGFGRSAMPSAERYTHAQDLKALLDHLGIAQTAILGHSTGGTVAIDFILQYPQAVQALILHSAVLRGWTFSPDFAAKLAFVRTIASLGKLEAAKQIWIDMLAFHPIEPPSGHPTVMEITADYSGWHWLNPDPEQGVEPQGPEQLRRIQIPVLVILGEREPPDMLRIANMILQAVPHAQQVILAGAGHLSNMEAPQAYNQVVAQFLAPC